uniref:DnaJ-like protein C11 C-terminal domain-containing protein n=1 Tax=Eutreptiella gymnastica TaxID=73025 RepID=A0A7S1HZT7_9EUGL
MAVNPQVMQLIFSMQHGEQILRLPVRLTPKPSLMAVSILTSTCALVLSLVYKVVVRPLQKWHGRRALRDAQQSAREALQEDHNKARLLQMLLQPKADAVRAEEEGKSQGLVILSARYGCLGLDSGISSEGTAMWMDVTIPCQVFVEASVLHLPQGTKARLDGFCATDPLGDHQPALWVQYRHGGVQGELQVDDEEAVRIP